MHQISTITEKGTVLSLKAKENIRENWNISDEDLLKAHRDALKLKLDSFFIHLLKKEINNRSLLLLDDFNKNWGHIEDRSTNG